MGAEKINATSDVICHLIRIKGKIDDKVVENLVTRGRKVREANEL